MEMLQGVWKQHLRPHADVGYGLQIFLPSPPNYVTRSPGRKRGTGNTDMGLKGGSEGLNTVQPSSLYNAGITK